MLPSDKDERVYARDAEIAVENGWVPMRVV